MWVILLYVKYILLKYLEIYYNRYFMIWLELLCWDNLCKEEIFFVFYDVEFIWEDIENLVGELILDWESWEKNDSI